MRRLNAVLLCALVAVPCAGFGQASADALGKRLNGLRGVPDAQRPAETLKLAMEIRTLPPGIPKLKLADGLTHLATEGDPGREALQGVATTLALALAETPIPAKSPDAAPAAPYFDLAKLVRYEHVTVEPNAALDAPLGKATDDLVAQDAGLAKVDFSLKDLKGKKWTLSELKGKIVLVNFWATWCPPCRKEMPDLDAIYTHFKDQMVVLSISDEDMGKVGAYISQTAYQPPVLLDPGGKVAKEFHVDGIPKSFVFDKEGKLAAQSIDMRTQRQFLAMLQQAGLHK